MELFVLVIAAIAFGNVAGRLIAAATRTPTAVATETPTEYRERRWIAAGYDDETRRRMHRVYNRAAE